MATVAAPILTLGTAVASPAGTVNVSYPTGFVQADFTSSNASGTAYLILNDNDRFEEVDDEFDISYDSSNVTVTNKTGYTWPVGTKLLVGLAYADPVGDYRQVGNVTDLGGTLTGTVDGDLDDVSVIALNTSDAYTDAAVNAAVNAAVAEINEQLKELQTKLNAALQALRSSGLMASS